MFFDFHTHHRPEVPHEALLSCAPDSLETSDASGYYAVGIHPWYIGADGTWRADVDKVADRLRLPQVLAVGEVGLDKLAATPLPQQCEVFEAQIALSELVEKPMILHVVRAWDELLLLKKQLKPRQPWAIHGFRGNKAVATTCLKQGFYLSFGEKFNEETLRMTPSERLLVETDESLLPIETVYRRIATVRGVALDELERQVTANLTRFFGRSL